MYILTDGKNYVMDDPIHPGRVMYSTSPVNAKKFTFKQARALLNNKSKKLSWIRSFNMVDDSSGEKIAEQEVRSRSNKGVFVGKNDIDFDVSILDQIMQETNNLLGIAGWNMAQLTTYQNMLSTALSKYDSAEADIEHALQTYKEESGGKKPQAHKFMVAVKNRTSFTLSFTRLETGETITKEVDAYEMFHKMCEMNWDYAEPGMLFWDRINNWNLLSCDDEFEYAGTNPCAEEPLPAGGSCLLGSINLSEFVCDTGFDFDDFKYCVKESVIALNEVLDEGLPLHPLKEQRESVYDWRQIGLGIFGLADLLIKLGIKYGSPEAIDLCDMIGHIMSDTAIKTSALLAKDHGVYPKYKPEAIEQSAFYSKNALGETKELVSSFGLRNSQLLTIAPTGSLSTMLGVSGGIEPIFANYYTRKTESLKGHDEYYKVYTPIVKKYIDEHNLKDDSELPDYFVTAQTLDYKNRIYMQSIWQSHIDASISSTVNVPNDFTIEQVESLYMSAWESGLKGVTIFRDGCKRSGILTTTSSVSDINDDKEKKTLPRGYIVVADDNVIGLKRKVMSGCGSLHIVAMFDPITGELLETYISKGSTGGCQSNLAAVSRLISLSARAGVDVYTIADQLKSCPACPSYVGRTMTKHDTSKGKCCPDAIANALIDMYKEMKNSIFSDDIETSNVKSKVIKKNTEDKEQSVNVKNPCPVCGEELTFEGGCNVCKACGWSKCD